MEEPTRLDYGGNTDHDTLELAMDRVTATLKVPSSYPAGLHVLRLSEGRVTDHNTAYVLLGVCSVSN